MAADVSALAPPALTLKRDLSTGGGHYVLNNRTSTAYAYLVPTLAFSSQLTDGGWSDQQTRSCSFRSRVLDARGESGSVPRRSSYTLRAGQALLRVDGLDDAIGILSSVADDGGLTARVSAPAPSSIALARESADGGARYTLSNATSVSYRFLVATLGIAAQEPDGGWSSPQTSECRLGVEKLEVGGKVSLGQWDEQCLVDGRVAGMVFIRPEEAGPVTHVLKVSTDFALGAAPKRKLPIRQRGDRCACERK